MAIQWFPGHMHKAGKEIKQRLPDMDLVIEVIDARIPFSSQNPLLMNLAERKPTIKVLNKVDLADIEKVKEWQAYFEQNHHIKSIALTAKDVNQAKKIIGLAHQLVPMKKDHQFISALIMGIPNVGKSTLINVLADKIIAKTGNEPAVTKSQQRIPITDDFVLFDTPGMLWPKIRHENWGLRLASTGAIKETAMTHEECAFYLVEVLRKFYPESLKNRYELQDLPDDEYQVLEQIGRRRGAMKSGGHLDMHKVSSVVVHDFRSGQLGGICLEQPWQVEKEEQEAQKLEELKRAKKELRKNRNKRKR